MKASYEITQELCVSNASKIVLIVIDGLGGLPLNGATELEKAHTPNLDALAKNAICGVIDPVGCGITPGSGPANLALLGYDPFRFIIERGAFSAVGVGFNMQPQDLAARMNFATIDKEGKITDRRAGRISTSKNRELCKLLETISLNDVELFLRTEKEHRAVVIFRGEGLFEELSGSDPQVVGVEPLPLEALTARAEKTVKVINSFIAKAKERLKNSYPANMVLLRGFAKCPELPQFNDIYKLHAASIALYPMYRGLARIIGMEILESEGGIAGEFRTLKKNFQPYDFFYLHIKDADSAGEDGNFDQKVKVIEEIDKQIPILMELNPDVIAITGDHSTPAILKKHSWHPVPILIHSKWCRPDNVRQFSENACSQGGLGRFNAIEVMPLLLAHALKTAKYLA
jgi:2,3-bisphosphoglycerate-independent phosphoglycerate mutase